MTRQKLRLLRKSAELAHSMVFLQVSANLLLLPYACCCNKGHNCSTFHAVKDHGVPEELVDAALRENERFFALPLEQKLTCKLNADYRVRSRACFCRYPP